MSGINNPDVHGLIAVMHDEMCYSSDLYRVSFCFKQLGNFWDALYMMGSTNFGLPLGGS